MAARSARLLLAAAACACGAVLAALPAAQAQDYPTRPVKIIVPFPAGGTADVMPRVVADWLSRKWGQPVVIENRTGAAGNIGAEAVVQGRARRLHAAVGAAAAAGDQPQSLSEARLRSDRVRADRRSWARVPNALVVNPKLPPNSVAEVIAYAKANPGKVTSATQGNGTTSHLTSEMFQMMADVKFQHVPYRGSAPALNDLVGGSVDIMFDNLGVSLALVKGGKLKLLGGRDAQAHGVAAGRADDRRNAARLRIGGLVRGRRAAEDAAGDRRQDQRRHQRGAAPDPTSLQRLAQAVGRDRSAARRRQTAAYMRAEVERWHKVIKAANVKLRLTRCSGADAMTIARRGNGPPKG